MIAAELIVLSPTSRPRAHALCVGCSPTSSRRARGPPPDVARVSGGRDPGSTGSRVRPQVPSHRWPTGDCRAAGGGVDDRGLQSVATRTRDRELAAARHLLLWPTCVESW